jgi:3-oxoacyl-[acyl-carrier protein] reductase
MKVALVTGASRGLGAEIAFALGAAGWAVAVNYARDRAGAEKVVQRIAGAGSKAVAAQFDVTDDAAVERGVAAVAATLGPIDLVVNNATGPQPTIPIMEQTWQDHLDQLVFFVKAPTKLLQTLLPDWRRRKSGRVINIGSEVVGIGNPEFAHYVAAKSAMIGLTRSWATELGPDNITVNLVAPGFIPTERHADVPAEALAEYARKVPLGRQGTPAELAGIVVFLGSPQADFITGQTFTVNGGRTLG